MNDDGTPRTHKELVGHRSLHILAVAHKHKLAVIWTDKRPEAAPQHKTVYVNRPATGLLYISALHELGHCVQDHKGYTAIVDEAKAWEWALNHGDAELAVLNQKDYTMIGAMWATYLPGGAR